MLFGFLKAHLPLFPWLRCVIHQYRHPRQLTTVPILFTLALCLSSGEALAANFNYPLQMGSTWTYVDQDGQTVTHKIIGIEQASVAGQSFPIAFIARGQRSLRAILRSQTRWVECAPVTLSLAPMTCQHPLVFLVTPLQVDESWSSQQLTFNIEHPQDVQTPFANYTQAWVVHYARPDLRGMSGRVWLAPNIGPVKMVENNLTLSLKHFSAGTGPALTHISEHHLDRFLEGDEPSQMVLTNIPTIQSTAYWWPKLMQWQPWLSLSAILFVLIFFLLAWRYLLQKAQKHTLSSNISKFDVQLIKAIASAGDLSQAKDKLTTLINQYPNYADLRFHLAMIEQAQGQTQEAITQLELALQLNPHYAEANIELGKLLVFLSQYERALPFLHKATALKPDYPDLLTVLARALLATDAPHQARTVLQQALALNPNLEEAQELLSHC